MISVANTLTKMDSNDLEMFTQDADMEESDGPIEQEFPRTNFAICVQCKNKKSNLRYRYCAKCYQVNQKKKKQMQTVLAHDFVLIFFTSQKFLFPSAHFSCAQ